MTLQKAIKKAAEILGLKLTASVTADDVNTAYRQKVKSCHPDVGGTNEQMVRVNQAKDVLMEAIKDGSIISAAFTGFNGIENDLNNLYEKMQEEMRQQEQAETREQRRERERKEAEAQKKEREKHRKERERQKTLKPYRAGCKKAYEDDAARIGNRMEQLFQDIGENPVLWKVLGDKLKERGYHDLRYKTTFYRPYEEYYIIQNRFKELYKDTSTYQARFRERKDGTMAGPYWYKSYRDGGRLKQEYIGRRLPESAFDEPSAVRRRERCMREAREWYENLFRI